MRRAVHAPVARTLAVSLGLGAVLGGCGLALGLGDFSDAPAGAGGAAAASTGGPSSTSNSTSVSVAGSGGVGGASASTTSSSASGATSTSSIASSGAGGAMVCEPFSTLPCYDGPSGTETKGVCHPGKKGCLADGSGYGTCDDEIVPVTADDCTKMADTNCDGKLDCSCTPDDVQPCYDGAAGTDAHLPCKAGTRTCAHDGSGYGTCAGEVVPVAEVCTNTVDDDCNGVADDFCFCKTGQTLTCYAGAAGTSGVGNCHSGLQACNATGTAWDAACAGQTLPTTEDCNVKGDEDCDGIACSEPVWSIPDSATDDSGLFLAVDPNGNSLISINNSGGGSLEQHDPNGKLVWSKSSTGAPVVMDAAGNGYSAYANAVTAYKPDGTLKWTTPQMPVNTGTGAFFQIWAIAADNSASGAGIVIGGAFRGTLTFKGTNAATDRTITSATTGAGGDGFVARLFALTGTPDWAVNFGGSTGQVQVRGVAVDPGGNAIAVGNYNGTVLLGSKNYAVIGSPDVFVIKYSHAGVFAWGGTFGSLQSDITTSVTTDSTGNPWFAGVTTGSPNFGGGALSNAKAGTNDVYMVELDGATGAHKTSKIFGGPANDGNFGNYDPSLSVDSKDQVVLTGTIDAPETASFGGPALTTTTGGIFLAKFDASGAGLWSHLYGDGMQFSPKVQTLPGGRDIFLAASNMGSINFGQQSLGAGIVLARIQP